MLAKENDITCTVKKNIRENRALQLTGSGATCRHYLVYAALRHIPGRNFIHVLIDVIDKRLYADSDGPA